MYIANNPDETAVWFAKALRIDPSVIKNLNDENPLYAVKTRGAIRIEVDEVFRASLAQRIEAATSYGFIKGNVDPATLLP